MKDGKIYIPAKRVAPSRQGVIKITPEAMEILAEIVNESGSSIKRVASEIIVQAYKNDLIRFDREGMENEEDPAEKTENREF